MRKKVMTKQLATSVSEDTWKKILKVHNPMHSGFSHNSYNLFDFFVSYWHELAI